MSDFDQREQMIVGPQYNAETLSIMVQDSGARTVSALHQLPPPPGDFVGRESELSTLLALAQADTRIVALLGMGGVGKTALALAFCQPLLGHYPDGQFFLDLRGSSKLCSSRVPMSFRTSW